MHMKHIILTGLFSLCLALLPTLPVQAAEVAETGTCGETAEWFLYDDGTMVIRGTGSISSSGRMSQAYDKKEVKKVVVEEGITALDEETFYECSAHKVILPNSLTTIGGAAFRSSDIQELFMPDSVVSVEGSAFDQCYYLEKVRLSQNLKVLSAGMFEGCYSIEELIIPDSVEEIYQDALSGMRFLRKLVIGRGVKSIGKNSIRAQSLREIQNHSTLDFHLKKFGIETNLIKWIVDGVRTNIVGAGRTAFGKGKKYKLVYKYMKGVTCQGRRPKTYEYGMSAKMPAAKKKGHVFFGWNQREIQFAKSKSWYKCFDYVGDSDIGDLAVMPRFLKISIKRKNKDHFTITADANVARCVLGGIGVRYSTDPTMKKYKIKQKYFYNTPNNYKRKFTIKAKKEKTYYIQFMIDGYDDVEYMKDNDDWLWSKSKVYKMK